MIDISKKMIGIDENEFFNPVVVVLGLVDSRKVLCVFQNPRQAATCLWGKDMSFIEFYPVSSKGYKTENGASIDRIERFLKDII